MNDAALKSATRDIVVDEVLAACAGDDLEGADHRRADRRAG